MAILRGAEALDGTALNGETALETADVALAGRASSGKSVSAALTTVIQLAGLARPVTRLVADLGFSSETIRGAAVATAAGQAALTTGITFAGISRATARSVSALISNPLTITPPAAGFQFVEGVQKSYDLAIYQTGAVSILFIEGPRGLPPGVTYNGATKLLSFDGRNVGIPPNTRLATPGHQLVAGDGAEGMSGIAVIHPDVRGVVINDPAISGQAFTRTVISANLNTAIRFSGAALAQLRVAGSMETGADFGSAVVAQPSVIADLTTEIQLVGSAIAAATISASMGDPVVFAADAVIAPGVVSDLTTSSAFEGNIFGEVIATADLETFIHFDGAAKAQSRGVSYLTTAQDSRLEAAAVVSPSARATMSLGAHMRQQIREAVAGILQAIAPGHVFQSRLWPVQQDELPCILVYTEQESITIETIHAPALERRELAVLVECIVIGAKDIDDALDNVVRDVEQVLSANAAARTLGGLVPGGMTLQGIEIEQRTAENPQAHARMNYQAVYWTADLRPELSAA